MKLTFTGIALLLLITGTFAYSFSPLLEVYAEESGVVTITFDDGNSSQYQYVAPLLSAAGQRAVFYVNSGFINKSGYMRWNQLTALKNSGHEIAGHTLQHIELPNVNQQEKTRQVVQDFQRLSQRGLEPRNFALPYGAYDNDTTATVAKTYDSMRAFANRGLNIWPYSKYLLYVRPVTNQTSIEEVKGWINEAIEQNEWVVLVFHEVLPAVDAADTYSWTTAEFQAILAYLEEKGIKTKTIKEALARNQNLIANGSFESGMSGWTTDAPESISVKANGSGSYPSPKNALYLTGSPSRSVHVFGPKISVAQGSQYGLRAYTDSRGIESGEVGFYIDEFDADGAWISGKWLGAIYSKNVIDKAYGYTPSSEAVATAALQVYVNPGTSGSVYLDAVELFVR